MKLGHEAEIEHFRAEVRRFVEANRPAVKGTRKAGVRAPEADDMPALRRWTAKLFEAGYVGADWPIESGGAGTEDPLRATVVG